MTFELLPGEKVLWEGAPAPGVRFSPEDIFAVPFALFWSGIVLCIWIVILTGGATEVDPIAYFILPAFLIVGLYMLVGRFIVDMIARSKIRYFLTSARAVIESGVMRRELRSVQLAAVAEIVFRQGRKGMGTVRFGAQGPFGMIPPSWPGARQMLPPTFEAIENAEHVYKTALKIQREAAIRA